MNGEFANLIGDRGESMFETAITGFHNDKPLFWKPRFLGEKSPSVDYLCELVGPWKRQKLYFFVQVKTTKTGYTKLAKRLKVQIDAKRARALTGLKAPVYVAGVDMKGERVFIIAAAGRIKTLSSMHTGTELDAAGRRLLWEDVRRYWSRVSKPKKWTKLQDPSWK